MIQLTQDFTTSAANVNNRAGQWLVSGKFTLQGKQLDNTDGLIQATQLSTSVENKLDNTRGTLRQNSAADTRLQAGTVLLNQDGKIETAGNLTMTTGSFIGDNGQLTVLGDLQMQGGDISIKAGQWKVNGNANISTANLDNTAGNVTVSGNLTVNSTAAVTNTQGILQAARNISLTSTGALNNRGGSIAGGGDQVTNTLVLNAGSIDNTNGKITNFGNGAATLQSSATLNNQDGKIESAGDLSLYAGRLSGDDSQLTVLGDLQVRSGDAHLTGSKWTINGNTTLDVTNRDNTAGKISTLGNLTINSSAAITNDLGKLHAGQHVNLTLTGELNNQAGSIQAGAADISSAPMVNNSTLTIQSRSIDTLKGSIINIGRGTTTLRTLAMNNDVGMVGSNGALDLQARTLRNRGGKIIQAGAAGSNSAHITIAQTLDNSGGNISSNSNTSITAQALTNDAGQISAAGNLGITIAAGRLSNEQGILIANDDVVINTGSLENSQGAINAIRGNLTINSSAVTNNDGGILLAASNLTLNNGGLSNSLAMGSDASNPAAYGRISGNNLILNTNAQLLNNAGGTIAAKQNVDIQSGAFNNSGGMLHSRGDLFIDTHGATLTNTDAALYRNSDAKFDAKGGIAAQGNVVLKTGQWDNKDGYFGSKGQLNADVGALVNTGGQVQAIDDITLKASQSNHGNGSIDNSSGLIRSAATTILHSDSLNNSHTGDNQGIDGKHIDIAAVTINNNHGVMRADENLSIVSNGSLSNKAALISAGDILRVDDGNTAGSRTLAIDNHGGVLLAKRNLQVTAASLTGAGQVLSHADLSLALDGNWNNTGQITSSGNTSIAIGGNVTNSGTLRAGATMSLVANKIDNLAGAEISGITTQIVATNTLTNRGLVDGLDTRIDAGTITNIGSGRIYGDDISLYTGNLHNTNEVGSNGVSQAASIAARKRLDIGVVNSLSNQEHALIMSAGDMVIGGHLDANRRVIGQTREIHNKSATIEADGKLHMTSATLNNTNEHLRYEVLPQSMQKRDFIRADGGIVAGQDVAFILNMPGPGYDMGTGRLILRSAGITTEEINAFVDWDDPKHTQALRNKIHAATVYFPVWRDYTETTYEAQVTNSDPGRITSGGAMTLNVSHQLVNDNSQILAGGALNITGTSVNNQARQVSVDITRNGSSNEYTVIGIDRRGHLYSDREIWGIRSSDFDVTMPSSISLSTARTEGNTATSTSATFINRNTAIVDTSIANAGSVSGRDGAFIDYAVTIPVGSTMTGNSSSAGQISTATNSHGSNASSTTNNNIAAAIIRTSNAPIKLPKANLYQINSVPNASALIETDPRFTNRQQWLGSDYLLKALSFDPALTQKRLGDAFYEQRILREQIVQLTGRRFLDGYSNDQLQYQALMNNGATFARQFHLRPGIALSPQQVAQLTSDIVWLVEQSVTLPDGSSQNVLVPQLYVRLRPGDINSNGNLLAADELHIKLRGDINNSGQIAGREFMQLRADNLHNLFGNISGDQVQLIAQQDLHNIGGSISAISDLQTIAGRELNVSSTVSRGTTAVVQRQGIDRVAGLYVTGPNGKLSAYAGEKLNVNAAIISNNGDNTDGSGHTILATGGKLSLGSMEQQDSTNITYDAQNYSRYSNTNTLGSQISGSGKVQLLAGNTLAAHAANVQAGGALQVSAGSEINITPGQSSQALAQGFHAESSGWFKSKSITSRTSQSSTQAVASNFSGDTVTMESGGAINIVGSNVVGERETVLRAKGKLNVLAGINTGAQSSFKEEKRSGVFGSGGFGITIGSQEQSQDQKSSFTSTAASTIGSIKGNVRIDAESYQQIGSDLLTPSGDVIINARQIKVVNSLDTQHSTQESKFKQSGLTLSISTPILNAIQSINQMNQAASKTSNERMKVLAGASAALSAQNAYDKVKAGQGDMIPTGNTLPDGKPEMRKTDAADKIGGVDLVVSLGTSSSSSRNEQHSSQVRGSSINAGGSIIFNAGVDGKDSSIVVEGSQINAKKGVTFISDNVVNLQAAQSTSTQNSSNKGSSGSVGFSVGTNGLIGNAGFSSSKGKGNGSDVIYTQTQVSAGETLTIISGGDTNLIGAVVKGQTVNIETGANGAGNLNVASVQDLSSYEGRQQTIGGSFSFGAGKNTGSINSSQSHVDGTYASVTEQSGIIAGDGGFNIKVNGNTDLKGGKIASTEQAAKNNKNSLTTNTLTQSNIQNKDSYQAESTSASFGGGGSMGYGSSSSNASSVTESGISAGKVTIKDDAAQQAKTGKTAAETIASINTKVTEKDSSGKLSKDWNGQQLMEDVTAQAQIMQSFGSQAARAIGDYAKIKLKNLSDQLAIEPDASKRAEIYSEIEKWKEGGTYRVALHTAAGALSGDLGGAMGAAASATAMPQISKQIAEMKLPEQVQKGLEQVTATALGALVGGNAGAAMSLNVDANNRQLHDRERQWAKENAKTFAQYYKDKTGQIIDEKRAAQMLLGNGYRMVDESASRGPGVAGPAGDAVAVSFIAQNAGGLFKATAEERRNPGILGGPLTSEQAALPGAVGNPALGLGTAALITGGLAAPVILGISGTPIFSTGGALGSSMWASPSGTATISATINVVAQYYQNGKINPVDVGFAALTGGVGTYGGLLWNMGINTAGGAGKTIINNYLYGQNNSVVDNALASGALSGLGYGIGKLSESTVNSMMRPTINTPNWATSGSWNLFKPNTAGAIGGTILGGFGQDTAEAAAQNLPSFNEKTK